MDESTERFFGISIAFILPGFVCLWGASSLSPTLAGWLSAEPQSNPAIGGVLYAILASLGAGLTISAIRWALIDSLHHHTGLPFPYPDFSKVQENFEAYRLAIELYYRHYQFYANMFVAIAIAEGCRMWAGHRPSGGEIGVVVAVEVVNLVTSRDCLKRYYTRVTHLLGTEPFRKGGKRGG
jgi:hypothetical protein